MTSLQPMTQSFNMIPIYLPTLIPFYETNATVKYTKIFRHNACRRMRSTLAENTYGYFNSIILRYLAASQLFPRCYLTPLKLLHQTE